MSETATVDDIKMCFIGTVLLIILVLFGVMELIVTSRDRIINELKQPCTEQTK